MASSHQEEEASVVLSASNSDIIESLLMSWQMPELYQDLKANEIDLELILSLDLNLLEKVLPKATYGKRLKLLNKIAELKQMELTTVVENGETDANSTPTASSSNSHQNQTISSPKTKRRRSMDSADGSIYVPSEDDSSSSDSPLAFRTFRKKKVRISCGTSKQNESVGASALQYSSEPEPIHVTSEDAVANLANDKPKNTNGRLVNPNHLVEKRVASLSFKEQMNNLDLKALLNESLDGKAILHTYCTNHILEDDDRDSLTDIIIKWLLVRNTKPSKDDFLLLRQKILTLFPEEVNVYYYAPKEENETQTLARGKLFDRARNVKEWMRRKGLLERVKGQHKSQNSELQESGSAASNVELTTEISEALKWLKLMRQPWETVEEKWQLTSKYRYSCLLKSRTNSSSTSRKGKKGTSNDESDKAQNYIDTYKVLRERKGYLLVEIDFTEQHGSDKANAMVTKWPNVRNALLSVLQNQSSLVKDPEGKTLLQRLLSCKDDEWINIYIIELLSSLVPPTRLVEFGKKSSNPLSKIVENPWSAESTCESVYDTSTKLISHVAIFHSDKVKANSLRCGQPKCNRSFDRMNSYSRHVKSHEKDHAPAVSNECNVLTEVVDTNPSEVRLPEPVPETSNVSQGLAVDCNLKDYETSLTNAVLGFLGKLYSIDTLSRCHVQLIVEYVMELLNGTHFEILKSKSLAFRTEEADDDLKQLFGSFLNMFSGLETEHKRIKEFKESGAYIEPIPFVLGNAMLPVRRSGQTQIQPVSLCGQYISMTKTLKGFLELPNVLNGILSYMKKLESQTGSVLENFVQGSLWNEKIKPKFGNKIVVPFNLYYDEYEPGDSNGQHSGTHKMGAMYYSIPCIPPEFRSCIENIFLACLIYGSDSYFGNDEIFRMVLNDIEVLENEGITVVTDAGEEVQVYFVMCLILGDNLGVHQVLSFSSSSRANYFCIRCKAHRTVTETQTVVLPHLLRTCDSYDEDVAKNDLPSTGIKSVCIWNRFIGYHCIENCCYDLMHDLEEGAWDYDFSLIIQALISKGRFTIEILNNLVQGFDYGSCEGNKPGLITQDHLQKCKLKFTAAESLCFVRYFGMIVGHLIEPEDSKLWRFYQIIHELTSMLSCTKIVIEHLPIMDALITEHHRLYLELFPWQTLKPKHHNMLHYVELIPKVGPLILLSCWRYEAKHRPFQRQAKVNCNYVNLPLTLAVKNQLKFCQRLLSQRGFERRLTYSSTQTLSTNALGNVEHFSHLLPEKFQNRVDCLKWVEVSGTMYKLKMVLLLEIGEEYPVFGKIQNIIYDEEKRDVYFIVKHFYTDYYCSKFLAFRVLEVDEWSLTDQGSLVSHLPTCDRYGPDGKLYVTFKQKL
ncbi:hypothetical protein ONE63_005093 [Megalurothrips usitatus]|uniref:C2H2-type domain-containing protein n=1 Tax=Megalurothrips usitatus TaxID=439358 RepID=A0AAV7XWW1_9NEOP|nr:hypothetical protein ONE63_005093 [Megalurothrips usitatus]